MMNNSGFGVPSGKGLAWGSPSAPKPQGNSPLTNSFGVYDAAVGQQAKDYDTIMGKFGD